MFVIDPDLRRSKLTSDCSDRGVSSMPFRLKNARRLTVFLVSFGMALLSMSAIVPVRANFEGKFPGTGSKADWDRASAISLRADDLADKGDYAGAEKLYRESIKIYPHDPIPYAQLGRCRAHANKFDEAVAMLKKSIALEPAFGNWNNLGIMYIFESKFQLATDALSTASNFVKTADDKRTLAASVAELKKRERESKVPGNGR